MASNKPTPPTVIAEADVDRPAPKNGEKSTLVHGLLALTPLLSVIVTTVGLMTSFKLQSDQNLIQSAMRVDADWRTSLDNLQKTANEDKFAYISAFEIESFLSDPKYRKPAMGLAAKAVLRIDDKRDFDDALFVLVNNIDQATVFYLVDIARSLSSRVDSIYASLTFAHAGHTEMPSEFLDDPERFLTKKEISESLEQLTSQIWKLESATNGLRIVWTKPRGHPKSTPDMDNLGGVFFLNTDLRGLDFRKADLTGSRFIGRCQLDPDKLPRYVKPECLK